MNSLTPPWRRSVRTALAMSGMTDSSKYMSPEWQATAENTVGWRMASTSAPNPPDDFPPMPRASRTGRVRKRRSISGTSSSTR